MAKKVAIIILNWNRLSDTIACVNSCLKNNYPNYQIILIDNGSKNNQGKLLQEKYKNFSKVRVVLLDRNYGFAQGNNFGIDFALKDKETKYIICLNNDTEVEENFIQEMVKTAEQGRDMVNAKVLSFYDQNEIDNLGMEVVASMLTFNRKKENQRLFCPTGCAVLYTRKLLEKIKLFNDYFDSDYFCYAEDFDLGFRALLQGFKPKVAYQAVVYHKGSASTSLMSDFAVFHSYRNIVWTIIKNLPAPLFLKFLPKIIIGHLSIILLYCLRKKPFLILKSYFQAILLSPKFFRKRKIIQKNKKISNKKLLSFINPAIFSQYYLKRFFRQKKK